MTSSESELPREIAESRIKQDLLVYLWRNRGAYLCAPDLAMRIGRGYDEVTEALAELVADDLVAALEIGDSLLFHLEPSRLPPPLEAILEHLGGLGRDCHGRATDRQDPDPAM